MTAERAPLRGLRVLVTRKPDQARDLIDGLEVLGATVNAIPLIEILPPEDPAPLLAALTHLSRYDWVAFTSANAVQAMHQCIDKLGIVLPSNLRIASVGRSTSDACAALLGRSADLQPESDFRAEGLARAFGELGTPPQRVLLPVSSRARDVLEAGLRWRGSEVDRVVAYRTETAPESTRRLREALGSGLDLVIFASPSAADGFQDAVGEAGRGVPVAVIGPTTAAAALAAGFDVRIRAATATTEGFLQAIARYYSSP